MDSSLISDEKAKARARRRKKKTSTKKVMDKGIDYFIIDEVERKQKRKEKKKKSHGQKRQERGNTDLEGFSRKELDSSSFDQAGPKDVKFNFLASFR